MQWLVGVVAGDTVRNGQGAYLAPFIRRVQTRVALGALGHSLYSHTLHAVAHPHRTLQAVATVLGLVESLSAGFALDTS